MTLHEKWKRIDQRLRMLDSSDEIEESDLLSEAYEMLISAYQEARELNDEMEEIIKTISIY